MPGPVSQSSPGPMDGGEVLTCAFCGHAYPPGTPRSQHDLLTEHVLSCAEHPLAARIRQMQAAQEEQAALRRAYLERRVEDLDRMASCANRLGYHNKVVAAELVEAELRDLLRRLEREDWTIDG